MKRRPPLAKFKSLSLERTACYGRCPIYNVIISSSGAVLYYGEQFVEKEGIYDWKLDNEAIELLNESIRKYGFFTMKKKKATESMTDMPSCILSIQLEDKTSRKINDYLGENRYPARLRTLERKIDKIIGIENYIGK
jgi:hypothetical protein